MISKMYHLSEAAITIEWGNSISDESNQKVTWFNNLILKKPFIGFIETVPAYSSLTVYYQPELIVVENESPSIYVRKQLENLLAEAFNSTLKNGNEVRIPVCYEEEFGLDLEFISQSKGISKEDIISLHQSTSYKVYMMGFLPGFSYMGKVNDLLVTGRKPTPRARIEKGAVGIAGNQTGIYPLSSPGGWQIIGSTPLNLFDLTKQDPFLFKSGDNVTFYSITKTEYEEIKKLETSDVLHSVSDKATDIVVLKPGVYTTIQDKGRFGFRAYGVPLGGAMDSLAHNIANALVGNTANNATIECTMGGLKLQFHKKMAIAVTGGGAAFVNGVVLNRYLIHTVSSGDVLEIQYNERGIRTYIAVAGGFLSNEIMNSQSATPIVSIGSPLKKGDGLQLFESSIEIKNQKVYYPSPFFEKHKTIRLIEGPEFDWMSEESGSNLYNQKFALSNRCDRMGFHLAAEPLCVSSNSQLLSTAVTKGTIQLTPNGQLIVLMNDCQTTGGYPRVGQIAAVDLDVLAQLKPGETINFKKVSVFEAEKLYLNLQNTINGYFN